MNGLHNTFSVNTERVYEDNFFHKGMRRKLVETLKEKGITDTAVLEAMMAIPRHFFLDPSLEKIAYEDRAFPIAGGQTISQPYTVAYQTQLLQLKKSDRVLEIGTGSAFQTTILASLASQVFTIERQKDLFLQNKAYVFKTKFLNIRFEFGDGFKGIPSFAPFDKILITAAAPFIPPLLIEQLKVGGIMVLPVDEGNEQRMKRIIKQADGSFIEEAFDLFSFVPMLTGKSTS